MVKFALSAAAVLAAVSFAKAVEVEHALTLEHLENRFYNDAVAKFSAKDFAKAGLPPFVRDRVVTLAQQEANHVAFLTAGLSAAGVTPTKECKYSFPYKTVNEFLALSRVLEGVGVSAYLGAAKDISLADYVTAAGSILTVEARHQAVIAEVTGESGFPSPYDTPLGYSQVYTLASAFIVSCPPTNPALPVVAFPALTVSTPCPTPRGSIDLKFNAEGHANGSLYMHVLNGLNDFVVPVSNRGHSRLPANIAGTVYIVVSTSSESGGLTDKNTVAGPAIVDLQASMKKDHKPPHGKPHGKPEHWH